MRHVPHVYLPGPWEGPTIALSSDARHHLERVLRRSDGAEVSYTDGAGRLGTGELVAGEVTRGSEAEQRRARMLTVVMAAPHRTEAGRN